MSRGHVLFANVNDARTLQARLKDARLREVWGRNYRGQQIYPDGVTTEAVPVNTRPDGMQFGCYIGRESWSHLRNGERTAAVQTLPPEWNGR